MLNHVRTLLINGRDDRNRASFFGEYVEPGFAPLELPTWIKNIRRVLFGATPDVSMLAWRTRQLLGLLHSSPELEERVLAFDPRVTYSPTFSASFPSATMTEPLVTPRVDPTYGLAVFSDDPVFGSPAAPDGAGVCERKLRVSWVADDPTYQATIVEPRRNLTTAVALDPAVMTIPLLDTGYTLRLPVGSGGSADVNLFLRPQTSLGDLEATLSASRLLDPDRLFPAGSGEPYDTYRGWWRNGEEFPKRFGALLLALVQRTEEVRRSG